MIGIYTFVEAVWLMFPAYGANGLTMDGIGGVDAVAAGSLDTTAELARFAE